MVTLAAGFIGGLIGTGGGFLIVPMLILVLGMPTHVAVGLSLASVTATAISSFVVYALKGMVNFRLGLILESATIVGALIGSNTALQVRAEIIEIIFGLVLLYTAYKMFRGRADSLEDGKESEKLVRRRWVMGMMGSFAAGFISGMIGIGGGTLKVPIMVLMLGVPMRTAIATSMFMISITASTAASTYFLHGLLTPVSVLVGVSGATLGAQAGSRTGLKTRAYILRKIFSLVLMGFAVTMLLRGLTFIV